jgi:hypothetical protein
VGSVRRVDRALLPYFVLPLAAAAEGPEAPGSEWRHGASRTRRGSSASASSSRARGTSGSGGGGSRGRKASSTGAPPPPALGAMVVADLRARLREAGSDAVERRAVLDLLRRAEEAYGDGSRGAGRGRSARDDDPAGCGADGEEDTEAAEAAAEAHGDEGAAAASVSSSLVPRRGGVDVPLPLPPPPSLHTARVVGTTCASAAGLAALSSYVFHIVLLDEASQMTEPASLLPTARFGARRLLAVGDPQQLPPVTARPPAVAAPGGGGGKGGDDPTATLFERLAVHAAAEAVARPAPSLDSPPSSSPLRLQPRLITLRTQYRCHPVLSQLASRMFYGGIVLDGPAVVGHRRLSLVGQGAVTPYGVLRRR